MLIQIILFDGFDLLDAIAPFEVFSAANEIFTGSMEAEFVSTTGAGPVRSGLGGLPIPASGWPDLDRANVILFPGAAGSLEQVPAILAREAAGSLPDIAAAAMSREGLTVATVCGGSLMLAMAGLLQGRPAVTHHLGMPLLEQAGAIPVKARVVDDGNLVTGGGVTSGLEVALHLVERFVGPRIAHEVETLFEHERRGTVWRAIGATPDQVAAPGMASPHPEAASKSGEPSPGLAGRCDVAIATPLGKQAVVYDIAMTRDGLAGTASQGLEVTPLVNLAAASGRLTWTQHITKPMKLTLRFDVLVEGDAMTGTAKAGMLPASKLVGSRRTVACGS